MGEFCMPSLGADMKVGTLIEWRVAPGQTVERGEVVAEVETDKGAIEIEIWEDGVVHELLVEPGVEVPVGTPLAVVLGEAEAPPTPAAEPEAAAAAAEVAEAHPLDQRPLVRSANGKPANGRPTAGPPTGRVKASPVARRLAAELGIDLHAVTGTGPHGVIQKADVEQAARETSAQESPARKPPAAKSIAKPVAPEAKAPPAPAKTADSAAAMRQAIARAMAKSNREIPHYYLETRIDMSRALAWLAEANLQRSIRDRILPAVLLIKATALALAEVPQLNGYWLEDSLVVQERINIGFAIALRTGGLVTPAIFDADMKDLDALMTDLRDLITRTRAGRLRGAELTQQTVTLTSLGDLGVEKVFGVIYPPQVALVGFGKTVDTPWAVDGLLGVRPILTATVAGDHRATDGRTGGQFLDVLNKKLQAPERL